MTTLLSLPADILRYHIFTKESLDAPSLAISSMVCKRIREFVPRGKRTVSINRTVEYGYLEVIKWLRTKGCSWDTWTCSRAAAKHGHLKLLQWLRANECPWDDWTCSYAAENGHLEVLKWARANGCPWNEWTCSYAAASGHLEVLQWARVNGCSWDKEYCLVNARYGKHQHVIAWIDTQA